MLSSTHSRRWEGAVEWEALAVEPRSHTLLQALAASSGDAQHVGCSVGAVCGRDAGGWLNLRLLSTFLLLQGEKSSRAARTGYTTTMS